MLLFTTSLYSFRYAPVPLQGKWVCETKSGKMDSSTSYEMNCDGYLLFKEDLTLESTCIDGFFPSGSAWEITGNRLILKDSDGQAFVDFEILKVDELQLLLFRQDVTFVFRKAN